MVNGTVASIGQDDRLWWGRAFVGRFPDIVNRDIISLKTANSSLQYPNNGRLNLVSNLIVLVRRANPDKVLEEVHGSGGKVLKTSLTHEKEPSSKRPWMRRRRERRRPDLVQESQGRVEPRLMLRVGWPGSLPNPATPATCSTRKFPLEGAIRRDSS